MKNKGGRPSVMTKEVLDKLEEYFSYGCSDIEACKLVKISTDALYKYQREKPEFIIRKDELKERVILKARKTVINSLDTYQNSMDFLKRKKRDEFGDKIDSKIDLKGELSMGKCFDEIGKGDK